MAAGASGAHRVLDRVGMFPRYPREAWLKPRVPIEPAEPSR